MFRQTQSIRLPLVGIILLCLFIGAYLFAGKRSSKATPAARIRKHTVKTPPEDALKYWTEDKMRKAKAVHLPNTNKLEQKKEQTRRPPESE